MFREYLKEAQKELGNDYRKKNKILPKIAYYAELIIKANYTELLWNDLLSFYNQFFSKEDFYELVTKFVNKGKINITSINQYNLLKDFYISKKRYDVS